MNLVILSRNAALYSTQRLIQLGRKRGHHVLVLDHLRCELSIEDGKNKMLYLDNPVGGVQAVIPRIGASATEYGASVLRHFETMGVYCALSSAALMRSRDKFRCSQLLAANAIPVPKSVMINPYLEAEDILDRFEEEKYVIKLISSTQGSGVILSESRLNAQSIIEAFQSTRQKVLIQEYIEESKGCDVRVFVVNGEIVATMERKAVEGDFRSNFHRGGSTYKVSISEDEKRISLKACKILGLEVAGVDILRSKRGPLIIEVNASPGLEGIEGSSGVDIANKIIQFVERKLR